MSQLLCVQDVLNVMVVIAVMVNAALIVMGGLVQRTLPGLSDADIVLGIVIFEVITFIIYHLFQKYSLFFCFFFFLKER